MRPGGSNRTSCGNFRPVTICPSRFRRSRVDWRGGGGRGGAARHDRRFLRRSDESRSEALCGAHPCGSADEAVRAVRILHEVLGVTAGISTPMLRKENTVRVVSPAGTSPPNFTGPKAVGQISAGYCPADVFDEPAHNAKCGIGRTSCPGYGSTFVAKPGLGGWISEAAAIGAAGMGETRLRIVCRLMDGLAS